MFVRIHLADGERILAACDEDILGMTFRGDGMKITVSETFYKGEQVEPAVLAERMKSVSVMNLVGRRTIEVAIAEGHVTVENVIEIDGVPHAQVVVM
ncbi:MAG: DUF424 family protein [Candidatus Methanomethylophilaceae archaeon]|nr:DUF424 family protein [Candidatus Methanomethylophilaceae archaeon]